MQDDLSQAAARLGRKGGSVCSVRKAAASRANGKKGGRPGAWTVPPPSLAPEAFHGPLGEYVRMVEPDTEAPAGVILLQGLALASAVVFGEEPLVRLAGEDHDPGLLVAVIGASSHGRKGTSLAEALALYEAVKPGFATEHTVHVHASHLVQELTIGRDFNQVHICENDLLIAVKRLAKRGHPGDQRDLNKFLPEPSFSVIGHDVPHDLAKLTALPSFALVGKHMLWAYSYRTKLVPIGADVDVAQMSALAMRLRKAVHSSTPQDVSIDPQAMFRWHDLDFGATKGSELVRELKSRAQQHTLNMALIYARLDNSDVVLPEHIRAAHALWQYCSSSIDILFG